jgi:Haem-NO-binding
VQGIILDELEKYVGRELGDAGLSRMRALTGRGPGGYQFDRSYPDEEVHLIVRGVVEATGKAPDVIMEEFAEAMVPGLLGVYGFLVNPRWSFLDFLVNTEGVIHQGVKLASPAAKPPAIEAQRVGPESVAIIYRSKRRLCSVAKGIVRGAATHYGVSITVTEDHCMRRGDPECVITVSAQD